MTRSRLAVSNLSGIVAIEVVDLAEVDADSVADYMAAARETVGVRMHGNEASALTALWSALPVAEQARCHTPPFGLRFFDVTGLVCEASLCWRCNNTFGRSGDKRFSAEFDGSSKPARDLLAACERATGRLVRE